MDDDSRNLDPESQSYGQILNASSIMGGVSVVIMVLTLVRTKLAAVLLGSMGVGLLATIGHLQGLLVAIASIGLQSSAVKQISELNYPEKYLELSKAISTYRRMALLGGAFGVVMIVALAPTLSSITFDTKLYSLDIGILGVGVFFAALNGLNLAILQGISKITFLAKANLFGSLLGTLIAGLCFILFEINGVAPAIVAIACSHFILSQYYVSKIELRVVKVTWSESFVLAKPVLQMGLAFVWSALFANLINYLCVIIVTRSLDLASTGIYSAALVLSGVFVGFVLGAMAADFYPRLCAASESHKKMTELINQQAEIGLLLALPGLIITAIFSEWAVLILYSADMIQAAKLVPIFVLGCFCRVLSWPLGFVLLATGKKWHFAISETLFNLLLLALTWLLLKGYGLNGVAIAFFLSYVIYYLCIWTLIRRMIDFRFTVAAIRLALLSSMLLAVAVGLVLTSSTTHATLYGSMLVLVTVAWCLRELSGRLANHHRLMVILRRLPFASYLMKNH